MSATYQVRVLGDAGDGMLTRSIEADNVAVMGPFIIFQQVKPLRAAPGQDPPLAAVYVVSADRLVDIEEVAGDAPDDRGLTATEVAAMTGEVD